MVRFPFIVTPALLGPTVTKFENNKGAVLFCSQIFVKNNNKQNEIFGIMSELNAFNAHMNAFNAHLNVFNTQVDAFNTRIEQMSARLSVLKNELAEANSGLDRLRRDAEEQGMELMPNGEYRRLVALANEASRMVEETEQTIQGKIEARDTLIEARDNIQRLMDDLQPLAD